jgi:hypothetical protein
VRHVQEDDRVDLLPDQEPFADLKLQYLHLSIDFDIDNSVEVEEGLLLLAVALDEVHRDFREGLRGRDDLALVHVQVVGEVLDRLDLFDSLQEVLPVVDLIGKDRNLKLQLGSLLLLLAISRGLELLVREVHVDPAVADFAVVFLRTFLIPVLHLNLHLLQLPTPLRSPLPPTGPSPTLHIPSLPGLLLPLSFSIIFTQLFKFENLKGSLVVIDLHHIALPKTDYCFWYLRADELPVGDLHDLGL